MVSFLEKSTGSAGFHQIIDFITRSHICYALTKKPEVCVSFIKQFWRSAEILTDDNGTVKIHATIDGHSLSITEGSLRRHLKLDDQDGITSLPTTEIFAQLALMGYATDSDKLTFQKGAFSPQWRFLIHNILHCLSPKKTAWEQFSSNIAAAVICLATNRKFNFSRMIFDHMVSNISSPHKFLMYPRFIQLCLDMQRHKLQQHTRVYSVPSLTMKVFSNMKRITKGFSGQENSFKDDEGGQEKASTETELFIQEITPTEVIHEQEGSGKASDEISTAGKKKDTAMKKVPPVSTAGSYTLVMLGETATYYKKKCRERKAKGKRCMRNKGPNLRCKRLLDNGHEEERKRVLDEAKATKKIDWNDPSVLRYHSLKLKPKSIAQARRNMIKYLKNQGNFKMTDFKGMSYNEVRPIFEKLWDFNQKFVPLDAENAKKKEEVPKEPTAKRKKSLPRKTTKKITKGLRCFEKMTQRIFWIKEVSLESRDAVKDVEYKIGVITEYLVNISKRRAFWSLNEDILKITILTTNTPYPSRKIRRIRACTHQRPQRKQVQYAISKRPIRHLRKKSHLEDCPLKDLITPKIAHSKKKGNPSKKLTTQRRQSMEDTLSNFMSKSTKRHEEKSNLIKEIRSLTDAAIRNQGASIKTLEIQIGQMSKLL
ncbi:hypothetical protein Tco_1171519 [Tanacetum coccineum]